MRKLHLVLSFSLLITLIASCAPAPTQDVGQIVAATFAAMTVSAPAVAATQALPATGSISGKVDQGARHVGVFQVGTDTFYKLDLPMGQSTYQVDALPAGQYYVLAFADMGQYAAPFPLAYSQYVLCGMTADCKDHTLIPVTVTAGQVISNINISDNYGVPEFGPYMIKYYGFDQNNTGATNTPVGGKPGSIAGDLSFPASALPAMAIVAYHMDGGLNDYYYVMTLQGQNHYQVDNLPAGQYKVVAYSIGSDGFTSGLAGGYSQAVPCGLQVTCTDHSLIVVTVNAGALTNNVNPQDWYAPEGTFPASPIP